VREDTFLPALSHSNGLVTASSVRGRLNTLIEHYKMEVKHSELLQAMVSLKVCFSRGDAYFFPSLAGNMTLAELGAQWLPIQEKGPTDCALRWQCAAPSDVDPDLPPGFMLNIQQHLAGTIGEQIWTSCCSDCVTFGLGDKRCPVSVLLCHTKEHRGIDVRIRGEYHKDLAKAMECFLAVCREHYPGLQMECVLPCMVGVLYDKPAEELCKKQTKLLTVHGRNLEVCKEKVPVRNKCEECASAADTVYTPQRMLDRCVGCLLERSKTSDRLRRMRAGGELGQPTFRLDWEEPGVYSQVQHILVRAQGTYEDYGNMLSFGALSEDGDLQGILGAVRKYVLPWAAHGSSSSSSHPRSTAIVSGRRVVATKAQLLSALKCDEDPNTTVVHIHGHGHRGEILVRANLAGEGVDESTRKGKEEARSDEVSPLALVSTAEIVAALEQRPHVRCVVLNVSSSVRTAQQIVKHVSHIKCGVGRTTLVNDVEQQQRHAVCRFVEALYDLLLAGESVAQAVQGAREKFVIEGDLFRSISASFEARGDGSWVVWPRHSRSSSAGGVPPAPPGKFTRTDGIHSVCFAI
jgi:hypothetical protein